jgi:hypothetical protein
MNKKFFVIAGLGLALGGCNATVYETQYHRRPVASVYVHPAPVYVPPRPYYVHRPYVYRHHPLPPRRPHYYHPYRY